MTLLELARKWLRPKQEPETVEEQDEQVKFRECVRQVWLEYHGNEDWAKRKLEAGINLTPEGLVYMEREIFARREQKKHDEKIRAELEKENGIKEPAAKGPDGGDKRSSVDPGPSPGDNGGDGTYRAEHAAVAEAGGLPAGGADVAREREADAGSESSKPLTDAPIEANGSASTGAGAD